MIHEYNLAKTRPARDFDCIPSTSEGGLSRRQRLYFYT